MLLIAVCDDEIPDCCNIANDIKNILEEEGRPFIIRQFNSGKALLQAAEKFDIIFLDIMMYGINGIQAAQLLRNNAFDKILVFISSSREYVFKAYDVEAFHYLVKPVDKNKLKSVLERAALKFENNKEDFIILNKERQKKKLLLKDIYYFEITGRIISAHCIKETYSYYGKMEELEKNLQKKGFSRCHKSFLVNLKYIDIYNRHEITLDNGEKIIIAKRRYKTFCKEMLEYIKETGGVI